MKSFIALSMCDVVRPNGIFAFGLKCAVLTFNGRQAIVSR
jgi:hypothetical protein